MANKLSLALLTASMLACTGLAAPAIANSELLVPRQGSDAPSNPGQCFANNQETRAVPGGVSRTDILHKQVTAPQSCEASNTCSVSELTSYTVAYGVQGTITPFEWISGGFTVTQSYTTGETYTCNGGPGDTICVWSRKEHTAYPAKNYGGTTCNPTVSPEFTFQSPKEGDIGLSYYCVSGAACRNNGDQYWQLDA